MNNTPRTDELTFDVVVKRGDAHLVREHYKDGSGDFVESDFVRQLERELNAANERIKRLEESENRMLNWLTEDCPESVKKQLSNAWMKSKEAKP